MLFLMATGCVLTAAHYCGCPVVMLCPDFENKSQASVQHKLAGSDIL